MGLAEDNGIPNKPLISKQQSPSQEKQEAINQRALSGKNAAIEVKKKRKEENIPTISHTQHRAPSILTPISTKRKEHYIERDNESTWV